MTLLLQRKKGILFVNAILIFSVVIMVVLYTNQRFSESLINYRLLEQRLHHEIKDDFSNSTTIKFLEHENA